MAPTPLEGSLEADEPEYDILYTAQVARSIAGFTDGAETTIDFEVRSPQGEIFWVRVTPEPGMYRQSDEHPNIWLIEAGTYRQLQNGIEVGEPAEISGWFSTVENPGAIAGKLSL